MSSIAPPKIIDASPFLATEGLGGGEVEKYEFAIYEGITRLVILPNNRLRLLDRISSNIVFISFNLLEIEKTQQLARFFIDDFKLHVQQNFIHFEARCDYLEPGYGKGSITFTTKTEEDLKLLRLQLKVLKLFDEIIFSEFKLQPHHPQIVYASKKLNIDACDQLIDEINTKISTIFIGKEFREMDEAEKKQKEKSFSIPKRYFEDEGVKPPASLPALLADEKV